MGVQPALADRISVAVFSGPLGGQRAELAVVTRLGRQPETHLTHGPVCSAGAVRPGTAKFLASSFQAV